MALHDSFLEVPPVLGIRCSFVYNALYGVEVRALKSPGSLIISKAGGFRVLGVPGVSLCKVDPKRL